MVHRESVVVRPLHREDAPFLCSIFKGNADYYAIFHDPEDREAAWQARVDRFLAQNEVHHYIIEDVHGSVGWLSCSDCAPGERELDILVVKSEYLHQGYGAEGLLWLIEKSRAERIRRITLNVNQSNTRAIGFYRQFGFRIQAEQIIPECNDAVDLAQYIMVLELDP